MQTMRENDLMYLQYEDIDDAADSARKSSVVLAGFTTAHARTVLYRYMQGGKRRQIYCILMQTALCTLMKQSRRTQNRDIP